MTEQRPVAWARFYPNGGPQSVYLDRPPVDAEPLYRSPTTNTTPGQGSLQALCTLTAEERDAVMSAVWDFEQAGCATEVELLLGLVERFGQTPVTKLMPKEIRADIASRPTSDRIYVSSQDSSD